MNPKEHEATPGYDTSKVDDMTLALLYLVTYGYGKDMIRAWKSFDWDTMNRLHEKGMISDPVGKAKSVYMTPEGYKKAKELFTSFFSNP